MIFIGQFKFVVDVKKRVNVPAKFREQLPAGDKELIILKGLDGQLIMYPLSQTEHLMGQFSEDHYRASDTARKFQNQMLDGGSTETPDSQGRIPLNAAQMEHAGLTTKGPVLIAGGIKQIHIWNPDRYREFSKRTHDKSNSDPQNKPESAA